MKILIATGLFPPDIGGPATYSKLLADELPKEDIEVDVQSFGSVRRLPVGIRHIAYVVRLIWHGRAADAVFAQDTVSVGLPALLAAHLLGKLFIVRVPGDYAWEQGTQRFGVTDTIDEFQGKKYGFRVGLLRSVQKLVVGQADTVIAPSAYFANLVRGWGSGVKAVSIYNGVDVASLKGIASGVRPVPRTIVSAGRLVPWKGFDALIQAMKKLDGWTLEIAGDGPEREALEQLIRQEGLEGRVKLLGRVDRAELARKIAGADVFALNSSFESFSFQIVEAMALGTPVVAARVGNLAEIVDDKENGFLVPINDQDAFVSAAQRISMDSSLRARLAAAARAKAEQFSIQNTARKTLEALRAAEATITPFRARRQTLAKLVRYLFSGGVAAVTDLVLLYVFTDIAHIWYVVSSVLAFIVAFGVSFVLQKFFTFQDHGTEGVRGQAAVYLAVTGANLLVNTALVYLLVRYMGMNYVIAQIVASIAIAIESYVLYGMFIFKKKS